MVKQPEYTNTSPDKTRASYLRTTVNPFERNLFNGPISSRTMDRRNTLRVDNFLLSGSRESHETKSLLGGFKSGFRRQMTTVRNIDVKSNLE